MLAQAEALSAESESNEKRFPDQSGIGRKMLSHQSNFKVYLSASQIELTNPERPLRNI